MRLIILLLFPAIILSQKRPDTVFCDCAAARQVVLKGNNLVGPTIAPKGHGTLNEISEGKQHSSYTFEKEHNSSWYRLVITSDGNLSFDIIPVKYDDDYDFMIFKAQSKFFCDSFLMNRSKPIRACISRDKNELKGYTGLKLRSKKELVKEGPGEAFLRSLEVKKGEVYYLVLDNVYENGGGHSINFFYEEMVTVSGKVSDEHYKDIKAEISITDTKGDTIENATTTDDGYYRIETALKKNLKYTINYYNEKSFFSTREISTNTPTDSLKNIKTILPTLKKGGKYTISNIHFYGNSDVYLPSSLPSANNLYKIMKNNPSLKIFIVGHTNGCGGSVNSQTLSENRAKAIKKFLSGKSIDDSRVSTEGRGCSQMLYSENGAEWQQALNRRVEILVQ